MNDHNNVRESYRELFRDDLFRLGILEDLGVCTIEAIVHLVPGRNVSMEELQDRMRLLEILALMGFRLWGEGGDVVAERVSRDPGEALMVLAALKRPGDR